MKVLSVFMACLMACQGFVVPATTLVRAPSHDSAVIRSDRLGGNFAYSVQEGHAYAAVSPVVQHVATPVAVSYEAPAVVPSAYAYHGVPAVTVEAPKFEVKTVEVPEYQVKTVAAPAVVAAPYGYGYEHVGHLPLAAPAVTVEAPKFEVKTVEVPEYQVKTVAAPAVVAAPYGYGYEHVGHLPLAAPAVTVEAPKYEVRTVAAPAVVAAHHAYGYQHAFPLAAPTVTVGAAHL